MLIVYKIILIIVILFSLPFSFDPKGDKDSRLNAALLCSIGIVAFIVSSLAL